MNIFIGEQENISMFSMCSKLTPRAPIPDSRIAQFMQPCYISSQTISIPRSPDGDNKTWFHFISSSKNLWSITISSFVAKAHKTAWSQRPLNQVCHQILDNCRRQTKEYGIFKRSFVKRNCYIAKYLQKYLSKCFVLI